MKTIKTDEVIGYYDGILTLGAQEPIDDHYVCSPSVVVGSTTLSP